MVCRTYIMLLNHTHNFFLSAFKKSSKPKGERFSFKLVVKAMRLVGMSKCGVEKLQGRIYCGTGEPKS